MSRSQADHSEFLKDEYVRCWVGGLNGENPFTVYHGSSHQDESFKYLTILFGNYTFTKAKKKKKDQCMPWVEEGKRKGGMIDGVWTTFWAMDIVVLIQSWWIHKPVERTAPSVDPEVKCGLWVTTACQCGLICYKCATLLGDVDVG